MSLEDDKLDAALRDPLTGVFNHSFFQREADSAMRRAVRSQNALSLLLIRLVRLETLSSDAANRVLRASADAVCRTLRSTDVIARHEHEMLILLPDTDGPVAELVVSKLAEPLIAAARTEPQTAFAVGIATYPENAGDFPGLMVRAREALGSALELELPSIVRSVFAAPPTAPAWVTRHLSPRGPSELAARSAGTAKSKLDAWEPLALSGSADDWKVVMGAWRKDGDEWVSEGSGSSVLVSKIPVIGSFHYTCEGWNEGAGEISILGRAYEGKTTAHWGFGFHVGADGNTCTKLTRMGVAVMTLPDCIVEPLRHYRLEMHYDDSDGRLTCYLDGQRLFDYVDPFHFPGFQIGFYTWAPGAHLRPLEVRCLKDRRLSAMHLADDFFQDGAVELARHCFTALQSSCATAPEAAQARLKAAICLIALNQPEEAQRELQLIRGTALEPFALAEEAALNLKAGQLHRGLELFEDVFSRFPESSARLLIHPELADARNRTRHFDADRTRDIAIRARFNRLGQETCTPPSYAQIRSAIEWARVNWIRGAWQEALDNLLSFQQRLVPSQYDIADFRQTLFAAALATGREELLTPEPSVSQTWNCDFAPDWPSGILLHAVVRKGDPARFIDEYLAAAAEYPQIKDLRELRFGIFQIYLAQDRAAEAAQFLRAEILARMNAPDQHSAYQLYYWAGGAIVDAGEEAMFHELLAQLQSLAVTAGPESPEARTLALLQTRWAIEHGDFDAAARFSDGWSVPELVYHFSDGLVFQALLASLKLPKSPTVDALKSSIHARLSGTELELAEIFLRQKDPVPSERWPHAHWRPEFRVWLARWLAATGDSAAAHAIAQPAIDPRYGRTHSQPALAAVLQTR